MGDTIRTLSAVADFTSTSFEEPDAALEALLGIAQDVLAFDTVLVSEISTAHSQLRVHAVQNTDPAMSVPQGLQIPLTASPCKHVADAVAPFTHGDMHADADLAGLPAAKDMGATSYVGVPVVLADGSFFGTLVGLDLEAKQATTEQLAWLKVLARLAAQELQRQNARQLT